MTVRIDESLEGIDWERAKADLAADDFEARWGTMTKQWGPVHDGRGA